MLGATLRRVRGCCCSPAKLCGLPDPKSSRAHPAAAAGIPPHSSPHARCYSNCSGLWPAAEHNRELNPIAWQKGRALGKPEVGSAMGSLTGHCRTASCSSAKDCSVPSVTERSRDTQWDMRLSTPHHRVCPRLKPDWSGTRGESHLCPPPTLIFVKKQLKGNRLICTHSTPAAALELLYM